jgi:hypothetical protein
MVLLSCGERYLICCYGSLIKSVTPAQAGVQLVEFSGFQPAPE